MGDAFSGKIDASQALLRRLSLKAGKGACMGMTAFDPDSSTNGMLNTGWEAPRNQVRGAGGHGPSRGGPSINKNPLSARSATRGSGRSGRPWSQTVKPGAIIPVCFCMEKREKRASLPSMSIGPAKSGKPGPSPKSYSPPLPGKRRKCIWPDVMASRNISRLPRSLHNLSRGIIGRKRWFGPAECRCPLDRVLVVEGLQRH